MPGCLLFSFFQLYLCKSHDHPEIISCHLSQHGHPYLLSVNMIEASIIKLLLNKDNEVQCRQDEAAEIAVLSRLVLSHAVSSARDFSWKGVKLDEAEKDE